jgi:mono/diheme cytochrome c family protein
VSGDSVWLFALSGTIESVPAPSAEPQTQRAAPGSSAMPAGAADLERGRVLFGRVCAACHGETGLGGEGNGAPLNASLTPADVFSIVSLGRNAMPAFGGALSPEERRDVSRFVADALFE